MILESRVYCRRTLTRASVVNRGVVHELAGNNSLVTVDHEGEARESGRASEGIATLSRVVAGAANLSVVGGDDGIGGKDQSSSSVGNTCQASSLGSSGANSVARRSEHPEALRARDWGVGDGTSVSCSVDEAKVISASSVVLEVDTHDCFWKTLSDGIAEECLLGGGSD